jgi:hypothetical protein
MEAPMRTSLPKAVAFSIAALFLGGALAATPASAVMFLHGGGGGGFYGGGGGGLPRFGGAPSWGGAASQPNFVPSGNLGAHPNQLPYKGPAWSKNGNQHQRFWRRSRHGYGWGGVVIAPELCDDAYCDNGYYYDDSYCWALRRVYNRYGKFVGWRRVYICGDGE